jgi:hypothetical protein
MYLLWVCMYAWYRELVDDYIDNIDVCMLVYVCVYA